MKKRPLGITLGDPAGIGPEILVRAFLDGALTHDFIVYGDIGALALTRDVLALDAEVHAMDGAEDYISGSINVMDQRLMGWDEIPIGQLSEKCGAASVHYIEAAARAALDGTIAAVVTLPVNKEAVRLSRADFTGHTELIAAMCGCERYTMMLWSDALVVTHVSTHIPLADVPAHITYDRVYGTIGLTHKALSRLKPFPRIAVAGLNPHAGEGGAFGAQDAEVIAPAVRRALLEGMDVSGPVSPDTVFLRARKGEFDAVVCMYHDQGHIPVKLLDFDGGVNVTLGLNIIRTSVDHGTAFDIAYKGVAETRSFVNAFNLASVLTGAGGLCPPDPPQGG